MNRIVFYFDPASTRQSRFEYVKSLAEPLGAEIEGVYATPGLSLGDAQSSHTLSEAEVAQVLLAPQHREEDARTQFDTLGWGCQVPLAWHASGKAPVEVVRERALFADWVCIEQPSDEGLGEREVFDVVSGCPGAVIVQPRAAPTSATGQLGPPETIMVAWNASLPAARAVRESLPALRLAKRVLVVGGDETDLSGAPPPDPEVLVSHLANRSVAAQAVRISARPQDVGAVLVQLAEREAAGLLVMGAFGHSRIFEYWVGGATRDAILNAKIPLLLAH